MQLRSALLPAAPYMLFSSAPGAYMLRICYMLGWGPTPRNLKEAPPLESVFGSEEPNEAASPSGKEVYPSPLCSEAVQEMNEVRT